MFSINTTTTTGLLICAAIALVSGGLTAFVYAIKNAYSRNMVLTLTILPAIITVVLTLLNGTLANSTAATATGFAIAGTFGLIRFRSAPGSSKDIVYIFLSMALGVMCATGYIGYAGLVLAVVLAVIVIFKFLPVNGSANRERMLKLTVPECMDYNDSFDDILKKYTTRFDLVKVKSTNMGSTFDLTYSVTLRDVKKEKEMIDTLRERNGNLPIMSSKQVGTSEF